MIAEFLESGDTGKVRSCVVGLDGGDDETRLEEASVGLALEGRRPAENGNLLFGRKVSFVHFLGPPKNEAGREALKCGGASFAQTALFRRGVGLARSRDRLFVNASENSFYNAPSVNYVYVNFTSFWPLSLYLGRDGHSRICLTALCFS